MATIDMSDDDAELERIRGVLLGAGNRIDNPSQPPRRPPAPPQVVTAPATDTAGLSVSTAGSVADPVRSVPRPASEETEFAAQRSFAAARPRPSGNPTATPMPYPGPVSPPPVARPAQEPARADATPGDAADLAADTESSAGTVATPADADLSALLGGVDVDRLRQVLAAHPDLFAAARVESADRAQEEPARGAAGPSQSDLATQGWRSWLVKLGIPMRKGAAERFAFALGTAHEAIRCDLDGPLVIGVTSYRGSCGKTSAAVLLARLLAEIRDHAVLAVDTDLHGTLLTRSVSEDHPARSQGATMPEVADRLRDGIDVRALARDGGGGYAFIPGSQTFRANTVGVDGYRMIVAAARQVYPIVVVDMAQLSSTALYAEVLASLDGLVMMSSTAEDGVGYLYRTQSELQNRGVDVLNGHRITALNNVSAVRSQVDTEEFARGLKHRDKRDVVEIPYDRHLASAQAIDLALLAPNTKASLTFSLAALFDTLQR